jgi:diguanylate cyclase (GGDEF)-like protein
VLLGLAYALSALLCAFLGVASWRRRRLTPAAGSLSVVMAGLTWWSLCDVAAVLFPADDPTRTVMLLLYPGAAAVVAGFFCLCRALADRDWRPSRRLLLLLLVEPLIISVAGVTNPLHHLVLQAVPGSAEAGFGPIFWLHSAYSYVLLGSGLLRVLRQRRHAAALHARQLTTVLVAAVLPTVGNLLTLAGLSGTVDLTALFFVFTGLLNAHAVFRQGLFEVVPIARARVLERLDAAIVVLDEQDRLGDVNSAAIALLTRAVPPGVPVVGTPAREALGGLAPVLLGDGGEKHVRLADDEADLDVRVTPLEDRRGRSIGRVLVVNDVTEASDARRRLTDSNVLLQQQVVMIERLRAELAEQAVRDMLTGLHNRRHLTRVLADEVARAQETGEPLSVVLLDVDHFKQVNDTYGHAAGDALLAGLGQALALAVRPGDTVARFGGEEFVVVLPGLDLPAALERAEQIREHCALHAVVAGTAQHPTLSAGVATSGPLPCTPDELLESADVALYRAKAAGRNCVIGPLLAG